MKNLPLHTFQGQVNQQTVQLINARELHQFLAVSTRFDVWINRRIADYNFSENVDFIERSKMSNRGFFHTEVKDYHLTLDMAKELCMLERSELGRLARQYFIRMEREAVEEIPRLQAKLNQLEAELLAIPAFIRQGDNVHRLIEQAKTAFFHTQPLAKEVLRYREMGLTQAETGKLLGLSPWQLQNIVAKLIHLGLTQRQSNNAYTKNQQAALPLFTA